MRRQRTLREDGPLQHEYDKRMHEHAPLIDWHAVALAYLRFSSDEIEQSGSAACIHPDAFQREHRPYIMFDSECLDFERDVHEQTSRVMP